LDKDHFGLTKVKDQNTGIPGCTETEQDIEGPDPLFVWPSPALGKLLSESPLPKSLQRNYIRMSLGGVHDEAEVRGHRKTYVGAMPGKILQNIKKGEIIDPVFILDELIKYVLIFVGIRLQLCWRCLTPNRNNAFTDNYLEVEYDLSKVLFVATANSLDTIHPALRDRMEIIELTGYTVEEKLQIALKHLVPKQLKETWLNHNTSGIQ